MNDVATRVGLRAAAISLALSRRALVARLRSFASRGKRSGVPYQKTFSGHDTVLKAAKKLKATVSEETARANRLDAVLDIIADSTEVITTATDRVGTIVGSLMSFARVDQTTYETVDVHVGIESALTLLQSKIGGRIVIEREYGAIDPLYCPRLR